MTTLHLLIIAIIQGITEFLPVSSSGHLALIPHLAGFQDQGQTVDVAAHLGSLLAVLVYFRRDVLQLLTGCRDLAAGKLQSGQARLCLCLAVATVPVLVGGVAVLSLGLVDMLREPAVIGWATILFGILLYWADRVGPLNQDLADWRLRHALIIGLWQVASLVPGASRSGVAITGARMCGFSRRESVRIAMLMAIPTIIGAAVLSGASAWSDTGTSMFPELALVVILSFLSALVALHIMIRLLDRFRFTPFVIYRLLVGCGLLLLG